MMKKFFYASIAIFLVACSPKILRKPDKGEKSHFGITAPSKAVFFLENENIEADKERIGNHTNTANEIYDMFGFMTDKILVGRTNAKTFKFTKGKKVWFLDADLMPKRTAMILFDGSGKPIVEYDSGKYLSLVKQYLSKDIKRNQELGKTIKKERKIAKSLVDSLWSIDFQPDKKYEENIIKNLKRYYSPAVFGFSFMKCNGLIATQVFTDLAQKQLSYTSNVIYEDGKLMRDEYDTNGEISGQNRYFNSLGLLDSVSYHSEYKKSGEILFKYLPNRIITRYNKNLSRDEYLLNENFQIFKKISFDESNKPTSEEHFFYDHLGRLIREEDYSSGKKVSTHLYEYETPEQERFSKMKIMYENDSNVYENTNTIIDGKETFINTQNGKVQSKIVSNLNTNCSGKTLIYDSYNAIIGVTVQKKIIYEDE